MVREGLLEDARNVGEGRTGSVDNDDLRDVGGGNHHEQTSHSFLVRTVDEGEDYDRSRRS